MTACWICMAALARKPGEPAPAPLEGRQGIRSGLTVSCRRRHRQSAHQDCSPQHRYGEYPGSVRTASLDGESTSGTIANKFLTIKGAQAVYKQILEGAADGHDCAFVGLVQGINCNWIQGQGLDIGKPLSIGIGLHILLSRIRSPRLPVRYTPPAWAATAPATSPPIWTAMPT